LSRGNSAMACPSQWALRAKLVPRR
jgi:hypothetical protein